MKLPKMAVVVLLNVENLAHGLEGLHLASARCTLPAFLGPT